MKSRKIRIITGYIILAVLLVALLMLNLCAGSVDVSVRDIIRILLDNSGAGNYDVIIRDIRLPRLIGAALLGGSLAVSGLLLQMFFSNPIAGPYVLGISSGAKLTVALTMIVFLDNGIAISSGYMIMAAFIGSIIAMGIILLLSGKVKNMAILIVCGVMIGYICSAITDFVITFADDSNIINLHNWSLGSFSGISWSNVRVMSVVVALSLFAAFMMSKPMSAYQLGEAYAQNLGVNVRKFRIILILLSSLLSACVTAFAGPISFVGIAVPHLIRVIFKTTKPIVILPASFMGGALFCLFCDLIARCLFAPLEMSISSVTAVLGAPVVIWMMIRRRTRDYEEG